MIEIYEKPNYLKVTFSKEGKYILFKWYKFGIPLEEMKIVHQKALDTLLANNCYSYIAETSEATGTLLPSVIEWWTNEWVPKLQKSNIKAIVTVVPKSVLANLSTKDWQAQNFGGITLKNVQTLEEGESFLKTIA
jgi:hypothetical protein